MVFTTNAVQGVSEKSTPDFYFPQAGLNGTISYKIQKDPSRLEIRIGRRVSSDSVRAWVDGAEIKTTFRAKNHTVVVQVKLAAGLHRLRVEGSAAGESRKAEAEVNIVVDEFADAVVESSIRKFNSREEAEAYVADQRRQAENR